MKYLEEFRSALKCNYLVSKSALMEMDQSRRLVYYFAKALCKKTKENMPHFNKTPQDIAKELGMNDQCFRNKRSQLKHLFYRGAKGKWYVTDLVYGKEKPKEEPIEDTEPTVEVDTPEPHFGTFDDSFWEPDEFDEPTEKPVEPKKPSNVRKLNLVTPPEDWKEDFEWETKDYNSYDPAHLYFNNMLANVFGNVSIDIYPDSYEQAIVDGVSKGIKDWMGYNYNRDNMMMLCYMYAEQKVIGRQFNKKMAYITKFFNLVKENYEKDKNYTEENNCEAKQMAEAYYQQLAY